MQQLTLSSLHENQQLTTHAIGFMLTHHDLTCTQIPQGLYPA
jgi:hypothetical protein